MARDAAQDDVIRILFCHYTADVCGGSDVSLYDLVTHLPSGRFRCHLVLKTGDPMAARYHAAGVEVTEFPLAAPRRALEPAKLLRFVLGYWPAVFRIAGAIRKCSADVVHVNTLYNLPAPLAARLAGRPLVWHVRELVPDSRVVRLLLGLVARWATRAVAISGAVAQTLAASGDRVRLVLNSTDLSAYETPADGEAVRRALGIGPEAPVLTVIGRLEHWKGQHVLVEAIPAVLAAHPNAQVLVVGGPAVNKPAYGPGLEARCRELGISDNVHFTGIRDDVPAVLAASTVLVLPTVTPEPFGLTVVEAMAAGCPVVATAAGGPLDTVLDGKTGWLARPDDPKDLAEKIVRILGDPARARAMGERGRARAFEVFSIEREAREMAALFEDVYAHTRDKRSRS